MENWRQYLNEEYYVIDPSDPPSIEQVMKGWQEGHKAYDPGSTSSSHENEDYHALYPVEELLPYREYDWGPEKYRPGTDWDKLKGSIKKGFDPKQPVVVEVGRNGVAKIGEGNHRLAIAKELGMEKVPVYFLFYGNVEVTPQSFRHKEPEQSTTDIVSQILDMI